MLTSRTATPLLAGLASARGAPPLLTALGFGPPTRLDAATAAELGVPPDAATVALAQRDGMLRALVVITTNRRPLRDTLTQLATRVGTRAPHFAWMVLALRGDAHEAALSTWVPDGERIRRATLTFEPGRVLESDAETLAALSAAAGGDDTLVHLRWHEILGREALSARFYRALERAVLSLGEGATGDAPTDARRTLALTTTSRLLFLSFLQSRGWLDNHADFLAHHCDAASGRGIHRTVLEPLFFGTLNTPVRDRAAHARAFGRVPFLNGGLFARSGLEAKYRSLRFRDEEISALFDDVLTRFRFTPREDRADATEAAIDPEMLGRAFECLMASRDRRDSGSFYTPQSLVERTTEAALEQWMATHQLPEASRNLVLRREPLAPADAARIHPLLSTIRVLDPACGSGAFLVHILERLCDALTAAGDSAPRGPLKRRVLTRSIFGVDVNPMAVWLCELRLWLATLVDLDADDPMAVAPLPNLDRNIRVGDALDGGRPLPATAAGTTLAQLRERYTRATGQRKTTLLRAIDRAERTLGVCVIDTRLAAIAGERRALLAVSRGRDLFGGRRGSLGTESARRDQLRLVARRLRTQRTALVRGAALPFQFASHFADAMTGGGFDLVVGNPPWVRIHRIPPERREAFRATFQVFRDAAWQRGATASGGGPGFAAQVDLAALFAEQSLRLTRAGGVTALLLPMKLWRSLAGGGVRRLLGEEHTVCTLEDWSEAPAAFDAAVYPSLIVVQRTSATDAGEVQLTVHRKRMAISWRAPRGHLSFDGTAGSPWLLLPPDAQRAFRRLMSGSTSLAESSLGSPSLGVKCGCNDAFLVNAPTLAQHETVVSTTRGNVRVESASLRPVLRGEVIRRWSTPSGTEWIVWTHGRDGKPLRTLPPATLRWLQRWRRQLCDRSDAREAHPWWSLYRIDGSVSDRSRVVWADVSKGPRATVLPAGSQAIPLNSCYVLPCRDDTDAVTVAAWLNSPLVTAVLDAIAEPARGGYRRYMAWTVACLPLPQDWQRARTALAPLGLAGMHGSPPGDAELLEATCHAYGMSGRSLAPLIEWMWR